MRLGPPLLAALWLTLPVAGVGEQEGTASVPAPPPAARPPEHPSPPAAPLPPPPAAQRLVEGTVSAADLAGHRVTLTTFEGEVMFGWDRNTLIYQPSGATSATALHPGAAVRAGLDPAGTAYWIQLRPVPPVGP
jgi:hypothetical protein